MSFAIWQDFDGTPSVNATTFPPPRDAAGVAVRPIASASANDLLDRLRVSEPVVVFASSPACGLDPYAWQTRTSGDGNGVAWNDDTRSVDYTLAAAGYVVRQSYRYVPYELGRPVRIILTGNLGNVMPGVVREKGQNDAANGVFWRRDTTGLGVAVRSSTSGAAVDTIIPQAEWNLDRLDGTGASGFTIAPAHNNVLVIEYVWLGALGVRWGLATPRGIIYCHFQAFMNLLPASYMQTACLPLRWAIYAAEAPDEPATMRQVCTALESEGGYAIPPAFTFATRRLIAGAIAAATAPAEAPIVAIRPALTVGSAEQPVTNRVQALVEEIEVYATAAVSWSLWYFPPGNGDPLTGGTWNRLNVASSLESNVAATALTLTGGLLIAAGFALAAGTGGSARGSASATIQQTLPLTLDICGSENPLESNAGANPGYLVLSASGTGNVAGVINVREVR